MRSHANNVTDFEICGFIKNKKISRFFSSKKKIDLVYIKIYITKNHFLPEVAFNKAYCILLIS